MAIKRSLGKLQAPDGFASTYLDAGAELLPISVHHAAAVEALPWHHRDPSDRMLIAQAHAADAVVVSGDEALRAYDVALL